mmetsp:Transcript_160431/g.514922  ORF Transcript_160431/g.514922 Transcript_160431/m.514922 type:complete len:347 (-) Transcript_160431:116-1156(-)
MCGPPGRGGGVEGERRSRHGIQPTIAVASTMISDVFPVQSQPDALSRLKSAQALGMIIGNYASGWVNAKAGPQTTYVLTAAVPLACFAYLSAMLPETHPGVRGKQQALADRHASSAGGAAAAAAVAAAQDVKPAKKGGAFRTVFSDPQCCLLVGTLSLYEFMNYAPLNTVSILFMKERLNWGPLHAGRFASGLALALFSGSLLVGRIRKLLGEGRERLYVTMAHCMTALAYMLWGTAGSARGMIACLLPMALGAGANPVLSTRFLKRAQALGLAKGEAIAVQQACGAAARMIAPQLFVKLWAWAVSLRSGRGSARARLAMGSPMLSVAAIAMCQELLHQASRAAER